MRVLAFDACLDAVSAAVGELRADGSWVQRAGEITTCTGGHAEALMPMLARVTKTAGIGFKDIDRIVTTVGPGGFTGVRVGVAAARALSIATGCALVGISSLELLAEEARERLGPQAPSSPISVAVDARRGMVFWAAFPAGAETPPAPQMLSLEAAAGQLEGGCGILAGSAAELLLARVPLARQRWQVMAGLQPNAATLARIGTLRAPVEELLPLYLRPPDAKEPAAAPLMRALT